MSLSSQIGIIEAVIGMIGILWIGIGISRILRIIRCIWIIRFGWIILQPGHNRMAKLSNGTQREQIPVITKYTITTQITLITL